MLAEPLTWSFFILLLAGKRLALASAQLILASNTLRSYSTTQQQKHERQELLYIQGSLPTLKYLKGLNKKGNIATKLEDKIIRLSD